MQSPGDTLGKYAGTKTSQTMYRPLHLDGRYSLPPGVHVQVRTYLLCSASPTAEYMYAGSINDGSLHLTNLSVMLH